MSRGIQMVKLEKERAIFEGAGTLKLIDTDHATNLVSTGVQRTKAGLEGAPVKHSGTGGI